MPVGTGSEEFNGSVSVLGAVERGGYGMGPVPVEMLSVEGPGVRSVCEFVKENGLVPVGTGVDPLTDVTTPLETVEGDG